MATIGTRFPRAWWLGAVLAAGCVDGSGDMEGFSPAATSSAASSGELESSDGDGTFEDGTTGRVGTEGDGDDGSEADGSTGAPSDDASTGDGGTEPEAKRVRVEPGDTSDAELVETLPVGTTEAGAKRKVVLQLTPSQLPDLVVGDVLVTPAEVQATTRCDVGQTAPGCDYNPQIRAQIILTGDPGDTDPAGMESSALTEPQTQSCTKSEHHCMFVFRPSAATNRLEGGLALGCIEAGDCHVNVVMWAWDPQARPDGQDKVLVGGNDGNYLDNGIVEGDQARLMAVRERNLEAADRDERETTGGGNVGVPTNTEPVLVYSHPLQPDGGGLKAGEQFVVEAKIVASVGGRARFSSQMFLTKNPDATDGNGLDAVAPKAISEHNGINCLPGQGPCVTRKVSVFRVTEDVAGPVYVNVFVKSAVPGGGSTSVTVHRNDGWLRSTRYRAEHDG